MPIQLAVTKGVEKEVEDDEDETEDSIADKRDTNPELTILEFPGYYEFRIENWRLARDGSGKVAIKKFHLLWQSVLIVMIPALAWLKVYDDVWIFIFLILLVMKLLYECNQILFESIIVVPSHGVQFETHRGFSTFCLTVSRRFVPLATIQDIVVNEGLKGWSTQYYIVTITGSVNTDANLQVAYENLQPHLPVLLKVYRGVHKILSFT